MDVATILQATYTMEEEYRVSGFFDFPEVAGKPSSYEYFAMLEARRI